MVQQGNRKHQRQDLCHHGGDAPDHFLCTMFEQGECISEILRHTASPTFQLTAFWCSPHMELYAVLSGKDDTKVNCDQISDWGSGAM